MIEFGFGVGNQLKLANYPRYIGFDISRKAISMCKEKFQGEATKQFKSVVEFSQEKSDLVISLDVIYHLVEKELYEQYMINLQIGLMQRA